MLPRVEVYSRTNGGVIWPLGVGIGQRLVRQRRMVWEKHVLLSTKALTHKRHALIALLYQREKRVIWPKQLNGIVTFCQIIGSEAVSFVPLN